MECIVNKKRWSNFGEIKQTYFTDSNKARDKMVQIHITRKSVLMGARSDECKAFQYDYTKPDKKLLSTLLLY